ncbi:ComF family protein [Dysgonomonas macrotermitis]|uniref:ComF family protein n=1 Tax=Dysgonomonas macrotermitis TaxID=1346286 RepID=A0A1M5CDX0_9BACT|nr:phosphoribosyltransferase family protein [Dysgonomonas macrotermitis]SHF52866.1 comF family protein [Dysgonomonas macrotermitis]
MMKTILTHFLELFFPRLCIYCRKRLIEGEQSLCLDCLTNIPYTEHCKTENNQLEEFFAGRFPYVKIASFAYYVKGGVTQKIVHEIKYKGNAGLGIYMGRLCGKDIKTSNELTGIDYIVPVPLHPQRLKERGYNQSLMLAQGISFETGIEINDDNLIRIINNPSQTRNSRFQRWQNTEGIFDIKNKTIYKNKHILLIDDVVTTGSTIEICAKLLLNCEGCRISIYTLASAV